MNILELSFLHKCDPNVMKRLEMGLCMKGQWKVVAEFVAVNKK